MQQLFVTTLLATLFFLQTSCMTKQEKKFVTRVSGPSIVTKEIDYYSGNQKMKGFFALPEGEGPFPGVLVVHEWWGQTEYPRNRARQLARNGYAAFAVDMYGDGKTINHPKDAQTFSKKVMADMSTAEANFKAAIRALNKQAGVDKTQTAALGYCFGGAVVLEMARRGVDLDLVASYHGNITPLVKNNIPKTKARFLIFNGAADPFVKKEAIQTMRSKLKDSKVRYKFVNYKSAKHGFTNPEATANGKKFDLPLAYNKKADEDSWSKTMDAFKIVFKK